MTSNSDAVYTHGYKNSALAGLDTRTAQSHAAWLLPHLEPGMHVLDVGPGPGTITVGISEAVVPGKVTGVELGQEYVELANKNAKEAGQQNLEVIQGNALDLRFEDNSIDVVFAFALLEHIPDPSEALSEFYRVLKPGGLVAVGSDAVSWHTHPPNSPLGSKRMQFYFDVWEKNGGHPDMAMTQPQIVRNAGFHEIEIGGFFVYSDPAQQAKSWPQRFREPDFMKQAIDGGFATAEEIEEVAAEAEIWGNSPDAWYLLPWFWALARKPA